ncbi:MAG TPA: hypothetical protein VKX16_10030 [Chloroflexota bacterium]|nr:hypothetical protein [Chloroflexota bacterium]
MVKALRVISCALFAGVLLSGPGGVRPAGASELQPTTPPPGIDAARPTVSGVLVAKPINGEGNLPAACRDRDAATVNQAVMERRGLVICTEEGRLVLLELSRGTTIHARYWGRIAIRSLRDGDRINAWGVLTDAGYLLNPTRAVQDTDVQGAFTDSQDFITAHAGIRLTLDVLQSDANGPVQGIIHAIRGGNVRVILCGDRLGTWQDLTVGKTIDISRSLFNRRLMTYVDMDRVRVVSCA